jgi:FKBP-type peptidyl-prolyl cis-trans isomerase FkpA
LKLIINSLQLFDYAISLKVPASKQHMMKKPVLFLFVATVLLTGAGCIKGDENCQPKTVASETAAMQALATSQGMTTYTTHSTGMLYQILTSGTGLTPTGTSKVFVRYTGKLKDGTVFDSQTDETKTGWILGSLIQSWQIGLPLINEGGKIRIVSPSTLAYGCSSIGTIPSSAILYFEIELVDVQ